MDVFAVLAVPVRRRIVEHLALAGELSAGAIVSLVQAESPMSQPAVSQHLRTLSEAGLVTARSAGTRRIYSLRVEPVVEAERWLGEVRGFWSQRLDALDTELARGRRSSRAPARDAADLSDAHGPEQPLPAGDPAPRPPKRRTA